MQDPKSYESLKVVPDSANLVYVPKLIKAMTWDVFQGNILDYGCGTGSTGYNLILPWVEATDSSLYSVDISPKMVKFAEQEFPHPKVQYKVGEIPRNFPFLNMQFDKVFAVHVFHFVPDLSSMLSCIKRLLKPGGQLGFTCTTVNCEAIKIWEVLAKSEKWGPYMQDYINFWPEWTMYGNDDPVTYFKKLFFQNTGFSESHFEFLRFPITMNADQMIDTFVSINPCLAAIPENMQEDLKKDYQKHFRKTCGIPGDSSRICMNSEYLCVVLSRIDKD